MIYREMYFNNKGEANAGVKMVCVKSVPRYQLIPSNVESTCQSFIHT